MLPRLYCVFFVIQLASMGGHWGSGTRIEVRGLAQLLGMHECTYLYTYIFYTYMCWTLLENYGPFEAAPNIKAKGPLWGSGLRAQRGGGGGGGGGGGREMLSNIEA